MKILIITQYFWPENFKINDFAIRLRDLNHEVIVLTGKPNYPTGIFYNGYSNFNKRREYYKGITIIRTMLMTRGSGSGFRLAANYLSFAFFASFASIFRLSRNANVVFVYEPSPITIGIPAIVYKMISKVPIFLWVQDLWPESLTGAGKVKSKFILNCTESLVKYIYNSTDLIFISAKSFRESIMQKGIDPIKIKYLPNWAEDIFVNSSKNETKSEKLEGNNEFKIVFAGNIGEAQDFESIVEAIFQTRNCQNIKWIIIGDGRRRSWLEQQICERKLENIQLIERQPLDNMPYFFREADAFLVTLKDEEIFSITVPAKVQSYLAFGKPILAMINGEGADIIKEAGAGFVVRSGDHINLAKKAVEMSELSKSELYKMGEAGKIYYSKNFDREHLIKFVIDEFMKLAKG